MCLYSRTAHQSKFLMQPVTSQVGTLSHVKCTWTWAGQWAVDALRRENICIMFRRARLQKNILQNQKYSCSTLQDPSKLVYCPDCQTHTLNWIQKENLGSCTFEKGSAGTQTYHVILFPTDIQVHENLLVSILGTNHSCLGRKFQETPDFHLIDTITAEWSYTIPMPGIQKHWWGCIHPMLHGGHPSTTMYGIRAPNPEDFDMPGDLTCLPVYIGHNFRCGASTFSIVYEVQWTNRWSIYALKYRLSKRSSIGVLLVLHILRDPITNESWTKKKKKVIQDVKTIWTYGLKQ